MIIDLSKGKNSDEWHFLHSPEMYYQIYEAENPDPEKIALEAYRKGKRDMALQQSQPDNYNINIISTMKLKK